MLGKGPTVGHRKDNPRLHYLVAAQQNPAPRLSHLLPGWEEGSRWQEVFLHEGQGGVVVRALHKALFQKRLELSFRRNNAI